MQRLAKVRFMIEGQKIDTFGHGVLEDPRILEGIQTQAEHCRRNDAPVTARIVTAQISLLKSDTAVGRRIANWPGLPLEDALPLRLAGGFHYLALTGKEKKLKPVYRGQITDQKEINDIVLAVTAKHDALLLPWLDGPPQTNEAGRSASFMAGLMWLSGKVGPNFELNELGASAGINTMMERYHYDLGGVTVGPLSSPMKIRPAWSGPRPPNHPVSIVSIQGCDQAVIDLSDQDAALRVKSYVWPEIQERIARMDAAIALATEQRPNIIRADALDWVLERLSTPQEKGVTRVFNHSIVWQYIPYERREAITEALNSAGAKATKDKPLAWMMLETNRETFRHELRIRYWPGGQEWVLLAEAQAHGAWVKWYGEN
jgi:hypothetical protein